MAAKITVWAILLGLALFLGFAYFSDPPPQESLWDLSYYVWEDVAFILLCETLKTKNDIRIWRVFTYLFVVRIGCDLIFHFLTPIEYSILYKRTVIALFSMVMLIFIIHKKLMK